MDEPVYLISGIFLKLFNLFKINPKIFCRFCKKSKFYLKILKIKLKFSFNKFFDKNNSCDILLKRWHDEVVTLQSNVNFLIK